MQFITILFLAILMLTGCSKASEPVALSISGYNYTGRYIHTFSVNGQWGGYLYTAAHEVRESFPLDTVRVIFSKTSAYPGTCGEVVYPGMHSDVGGGYEPGEQGRSAVPESQLSQVPLLHMLRVAANDAHFNLLRQG